MKTIRYFTYSFLLLSAGFLHSCKDALKEEVFSFVATENYWKTEADAEAGIIGTYESFLNSNYYGRFYFELTELPADFVTINRNDTYQTLDRWDLIANHPFVLQVWNTMYQQISRANGVIQYVPAIAMDEQKKQAIVGEAKFIRAFNYFNIVRLWGDSPMPLAVIDNLANTSLPRTSKTQIYAQIEQDLQEAEAVLPETRTGAAVGRATSGAAKTLLAWVYLTQEKWQEAASKSNEVIGKYQLLPKFGDVFSGTNENNAEIIFSVQFDGTNRGHSLTSFAHAGGTQNPNCTNGVRVYSVDNKSDIWTKWDTTEARRNFSVYRYFTGRNGTRQDVGNDYPAFGKYNAPSETGINNSYINPIVLRYPDVLLIFAEAESQAKGGPTAEAYEAINKIRRRAYNLPVDQPSATVDLTGLSQQAFRDAVIQERGFEFVMECKRLYDLLRTGTFKSKIQSLGKAATAGDLLPIPQSEIDANAEMTSADQNPGY